mgnify:CR=1 FL=1
MKQLPLSKLQSLFAAVSAAQTLYIPADDAAGQALSLIHISEPTRPY